MLESSPSVPQDTGCRYHPECLTCPFDDCYLDRKEGSPRAALRAEKQRQVIEAFHSGVSIEILTRQFLLSERTIYRWLRGVKIAEGVAI